MLPLPTRVATPTTIAAQGQVPSTLLCQPATKEFLSAGFPLRGHSYEEGGSLVAHASVCVQSKHDALFFVVSLLVLGHRTGSLHAALRQRVAFRIFTCLLVIC